MQHLDRNKIPEFLRNRGDFVGGMNPATGIITRSINLKGADPLSGKSPFLGSPQIITDVIGRNTFTIMVV